MKHNCSNAQGFILAMTLFLLAIVTTTLLYWLEALWLYRQSCHMIERKHKNFYALEKLAFGLINKQIQITQPDCIVSASEPTVIIQNIYNVKSCKTTISRRQFNYIIEDLGAFPCHLLLSVDHWQASHHWRLSIVGKDQNNMALQIRYADIELAPLPCDGHKLMQLHGRIMSYRYFAIPDTLF